MKLILRAKRKRRSLRFGSGYSRVSWVDRPPRGGETSRRPLRRHRPGYRCKILLSGGGGEKERGRDFNLHEAAVSSSGNYSAGLVRERHVEEGTCVGRSARGGRGREEAGEQCRGIETAREKARGTDVISSSWKSSLELGVGIRVPRIRDFCIGFSFEKRKVSARASFRRMEKESETLNYPRNYSKFPNNGATNDNR